MAVSKDSKHLMRALEQISTVAVESGVAPVRALEVIKALADEALAVSEQPPQSPTVRSSRG